MTMADSSSRKGSAARRSSPTCWKTWPVRTTPASFNALRTLTADQLRDVLWARAMAEMQHERTSVRRTQKNVAGWFIAWQGFCSDIPTPNLVVREGERLPSDHPAVRHHRRNFVPADTSPEEIRRIAFESRYGGRS
jgi:hypothetical protein